MVLKPICALLSAALLLPFSAKAETYKCDVVAMADGIYVRTDAGGGYRLDIQRERWVALQDRLPGERTGLLGVESASIERHNPATNYLLADTYYVNSGSSTILRSRDYDKTFEITDTSLQLKHAGAMWNRPAPRIFVGVSRMDTAVPDPGGLALLTLGVTAPAWSRRRRKRPV